MIRRILRHEWRTLAADRTLAVIAVIFLLTFGYGLANGIAWTRFQQDTLAAAHATQEERTQEIEQELFALANGAEAPPSWLDPRAPNVLGGNVGARHAGLPPAPLAAFSIGQSDLLPYYYSVSIWTNEQAFLQSGEIENPLNLMAGRFDLAFVIVVLFPLLILALSYNVLSGEKEQGTLAMTLAQPIRLSSLVWGKVAFRAALVIALAAGLPIIGALLAGVDLASPGTPARLALFAAVVAAYGLFWFALAVGVNALGRGSAANATILAAAWLVFVIILPSALNVAANLLHPLPPRVEMIGLQREASNEAAARRSELLARYFEDHPEMARAIDVDTTNVAARSWASQQEVDRRMREVLARHDERLAAQRSLVRRYRFFSPAVLALEALNDIAGTGDARFAHFRAEVWRFADEWKAFFVPRILSGTQVRAADISWFPEFVWNEEPARATVARVVGSLLGLAALFALVWIWAALSMRRYRVVA